MIISVFLREVQNLRRDCFPNANCTLNFENLRRVVLLRSFGLTLKQTGDVLGGLSRDRVRQIQNKAERMLMYAHLRRSRDFRERQKMDGEKKTTRLSSPLVPTLVKPTPEEQAYMDKVRAALHHPRVFARVEKANVALAAQERLRARLRALVVGKRSYP